MNHLLIHRFFLLEKLKRTVNLTMRFCMIFTMKRKSSRTALSRKILSTSQRDILHSVKELPQGTEYTVIFRVLILFRARTVSGIFLKTIFVFRRAHLIRLLQESLQELLLRNPLSITMLLITEIMQSFSSPQWIIQTAAA